MDRLTRWNDKTEAAELKDWDEDYWRDFMSSLDTVDWLCIYGAIDKLAEYEDLEEQELLLKFPCKIGGTFFKIIQGEIYELVFDNMRVNTFIKDKITFVCHVKGRNWDTRYVDSKDKIYKTKEEAEYELEKIYFGR